MRLDDALDQLRAIHAQVLRSEVYRGYRALPTAATGLMAIGAAVLQTTWAPPADVAEFATFWIVVAAIAAATAAGDLLIRAIRHDDRLRRRQTAAALAQLAPALAIGAAATPVMLAMPAPAATLLPALWALWFALALFASRPFLPRRMGFVAAFYAVAGFLLLTPGLREPLPAPFGMGMTFGIGQLAAALVLHLDLERNDAR